MYHVPLQLETRLHRSESVSSASNSAFHIDTPPNDYQLSQFDDVSTFSGDGTRLSPISTRDSQSAEPSAAISSSSSTTPAAGTSAKPIVAERRPSYGKSRREKPRLELAPDQPLTTQGKPRCRVYVACVQCRSRKIRCDGAKPACHNCSRRSDQSGPCTYDPEPKRRGPDKTPGARQRSLTAPQDEVEPKRRSRRRTVDDPSAANPVDPKGVASAPDPVPMTARSLPTPVSLRALSPSTGVRAIATTSQGSGSVSHEGYASGSSGRLGSTVGVASTSMHPVPVSMPQVVESYPSETIQAPYTFATTDTAMMQHGDVYGHRSFAGHDIPAEPSLRYARDTWWDVVLSLYSASYDYPQGYPAPLPPGMRATATQLVHADLRVLFRYSSYWLSFLNIPRVLRRLRDPEGRASLQPSFVLGALALATFLQSSDSEKGKGAAGRERALSLKDEAQSALEASLASRWVDDNLVQAAWMLAFFEICAHPLHTSDRVRSAVSMLDSLIRYLSLASLDADDPRVTVFASRSAPVVSSDPQQQRHREPAEFIATQQVPQMPLPSNAQAKCWCASYTLWNMSPDAMELAPLWSHTAGWLADWTEGDIRREECRRLVWSSIIMVAGYASYNTATGKLTPELSLMDPSNLAVLFPGESLFPPGARHSKDTVWALYMRSLLLWNGCVHMRNDASMSDADKAQYAMDAWIEIDAIETALSHHTCNIERTFMFVSRDYLFISRLYLYYALQRLVPHIQLNAQLLRQKEDEWLTHHDSMARRAMYGLHTVTGQPTSCLSGRPFYVFWYMGQVSRSGMIALWSNDNTLLIALQACKSLFAPLEYLLALWPCEGRSRRFSELRGRLVEACNIASIAPPVPATMTPRFLSGTI
ncbi:hypothetical protein DAEQUDRAFT_661448 [Daedalea quercina L-15889]|uniref:Zn(2)-C6 fungal-type domain-containing protein n=1 Tax=Daedalea quercina L-15889 TaxID=1314783 RepID=A0A165TQ58_9APHY|nr:hypothetical protein DAEQUDRAFT_661448 [Daedalea quercina L-15889]